VTGSTISPIVTPLSPTGLGVHKRCGTGATCGPEGIDVTLRSAVLENIEPGADRKIDTGTATDDIPSTVDDAGSEAATANRQVRFAPPGLVAGAMTW